MTFKVSLGFGSSVNKCASCLLMNYPEYIFGGKKTTRNKTTFQMYTHNTLE